MTIEVVIFNFSQLNHLITFCRTLQLFSSQTFKTNKMEEAPWEILDSMFANLDLDGDIECRFRWGYRSIMRFIYWWRESWVSSSRR